MRDVRTNDDTLITVKLMLFYELVDVDTMVSAGCVINSVNCVIVSVICAMASVVCVITLIVDCTINCVGCIKVNVI